MSTAPIRRLPFLSGGVFVCFLMVAGHVAATDMPATIVGLDGRPVELKAPAGGVLAVVFYSTECPISDAYSPTLLTLAKQFAGPKVRMVGLCSDPDLEDAKVREHAAAFGLAFPIARDADQRVAKALGATVTPEAVVVDDAGRIRYRGRIDDQFAARGKRNMNPRTHDLRDAINAVLEGREPKPDRTKAVGCPLPELRRKSAAVSYAKDVAPILNKNCRECHRPGQVGPFGLTSYKEAAKRAGDIARVVEGRSMPPWEPDPHFGPAFNNDRSLSEAEIRTVIDWAESGAPEGDPKDLPPSPTFADDWSLGTPDLVLEPAEEFTIPATGADIYRCFVMPTNLPADAYVSAIEYRPGNRRVVHHVLSYVDATGRGRERDRDVAGPGYNCSGGPGVEIHGDLGGWAPGNEPSRLPDGIGRSLPKGADVIMQVHYHPSGKVETDRTRIGLYFSKGPVKQTLHWGAAGDFELKIPAGEAGHSAGGKWTLPVDCTALAVTPHMHMIGKDIVMKATLPDGKVVPLVRINDWDFGRQNTYYFREPIDLPKGTVLRVDAHYDNSVSNPRNPNSPPKEIRWGEATTDEMCIGFIALVKKGQDLTRPGEKDDLRSLIDQEAEDFRTKRKEAAEKDVSR